MRLSHRSWRTIAYYRGVGSVESKSELKQCLREQMTSRERAGYYRGVAWSILAAVAAGLFCVWHGHPAFGVFLAVVVYGVAYQRVDPLYRAQRQYLADLETELRLQNERVRQEKEKRRP